MANCGTNAACVSQLCGYFCNTELMQLGSGAACRETRCMTCSLKRRAARGPRDVNSESAELYTGAFHRRRRPHGGATPPTDSSHRQYSGSTCSGRTDDFPSSSGRVVVRLDTHVRCLIIRAFPRDGVGEHADSSPTCRLLLSLPLSIFLSCCGRPVAT